MLEPLLAIIVKILVVLTATVADMCPLSRGEHDVSGVGTTPIIRWLCPEKDRFCPEKGRFLDGNLVCMSPIVAADGVTFCSIPDPKPSLFLRCLSGSTSVPCTYLLPPGHKLQFQCDDFYRINNKSLAESECLPTGVWSTPSPDCIADCGKMPTAVPLVVHGTTVQAKSFPWHAALYHQDGDQWEHCCGGSLISRRMVLTAAHCTWQTPPEKLKVGLQKYFRAMNKPGEQPLILDVMKVEMLSTYQDVSGNYNGDLSVIILKTQVLFTENIVPICIDWGQNYIEKQLQAGNSGIVVGWGLTEKDEFGEELRGIRLPVMADEQCIQHQNRDFRKFITYTTFCAGYTNGSGVCNGDSGGGLAFLDKDTDTWYLQGLVSVSPRRLGTPFCDPTHYTVFTKVSMFTKWLRKMKEIEKHLAQEDSSR